MSDRKILPQTFLTVKFIERCNELYEAVLIINIKLWFYFQFFYLWKDRDKLVL